jgi:undecaprenyl-diphosphatase
MLKEIFYDWCGANMDIFIFINQLHAFKELDIIMIICSEIAFYSYVPLYLLLIVIYVIYYIKAAPTIELCTARTILWFRIGLGLTLSYMLAGVIMLLLKQYCYMPRPFCLFYDIPPQRYLLSVLSPPLVDAMSQIKCNHSFPSGHTAFMIIMVANLWLGMNWLFRILGIGLIALVALSRIYLYAHFPADILGGAIVAVTITLFVQLILWKFLVKLWHKYA